MSYACQRIWYPTTSNIFLMSELTEKKMNPAIKFLIKKNGWFNCLTNNLYYSLLIMLLACTYKLIQLYFFKGTPLPAVPGWDSVPSIYWWWSWRKFSWLFSSSLTSGKRYLWYQISYRKIHPVCSHKEIWKILTIWQWVPRVNVLGNLTPFFP